MLDIAHSNRISILVIIAAMIWAVRGPQKTWHLSAFYLWLTFILTLLLLKDLAQGLANWLGRDELAVFRVIGVAHIIIVATALWRLGAWSRAQRGNQGHAPMVRMVAAFWVMGAVVFWVGARTFPGMTLEAIATEPAAHMWTSGNFLIATLITLVGLIFFTLVLFQAGDRYFSILGLFAFSFGAVFWILHLAFRLTVIRTVAESYGQTSVAPPWFQPWMDWNGLLFGIYSVLAYLGIAAYGGAMIWTGLTPRWIGRGCVIVGLLAAPLIGPPFFIHAVLWLVGILFLTRSEYAIKRPG